MGPEFVLPRPANQAENDEIVAKSTAKYTSTAQDIWIDVLHKEGAWTLANGYANWANEDKAQDPETNGDAALIKTGTKQQPNGAWKQQSSTDPKSKGTGRIFFTMFFFVNESY